MPDLVANVRDASWFNRPRHDALGTRRVDSVRYHVELDHPDKGEGWSACGTAFLIEGGPAAHTVDAVMRCRRNGCRQAFAQADARSASTTPEGTS